MTPTQKQFIKDLNKQLKGLSYEEALESLKTTNHLLYICAVKVDGENQVCDANYKMNRLNVYIKDGLIEVVKDFG